MKYLICYLAGALLAAAVSAWPIETRASDVLPLSDPDTCLGSLLDTDVINPDGSSPFESSDLIPKINNFTVSSAGIDAQIGYIDYSGLYGSSLMHVSDMPAGAADVWGLGTSLEWSFAGDFAGLDINLQVVAKMSVQLPDGTQKSHQVIIQDYDGAHPGNSTVFKIHASDGCITLSLFDLLLALEGQYTEYIQNPPVKLVDVVYYLTPFYYNNGTYYRGEPASVAHSINEALAPAKACQPEAAADSSFDWACRNIIGAAAFLLLVSALKAGCRKGGNRKEGGQI